MRSQKAESYVELNFSPSSEWAAYSFASYRAEMAEHPVGKSLEIGLDASEGYFALEVTITIPTGSLAVGFSAVIEETSGTKSYWALAHPPGKPDFHHPACFAATLPAPKSA